RQYFFNNNKYLPYESAYHILKLNDNYALLLTGASQSTMKVVDRSMKSFFSLLNKRAKGLYQYPVRLPRYLKKDGLFAIVLSPRAFRVRGDKLLIGFSKKFREKHKPEIKDLVFKIPANIRGKEIKEVRIIPMYNGLYFNLEYIYEEKPIEVPLNYSEYLAIDLGLDNFATFVESATGSAIILDGKELKSINQWYNKENARLQSIKDKQKIKKPTKRQYKLFSRRNYKINEGLNKAVNLIIKTCIEKKIGNVVIGELKNIKQGINLGKRNNQNFVQIPYRILKQKLKSKCELYGINYDEVDEAYTSKLDALAFEPIQKHNSYLGKRVKRGLFQSSTGTMINADVNGALNILRKEVSDDSLVKEIISRGLVNRPKRIRLFPSKLLSN
ncbi:MAG: RNA-guided endonuclease InsQ/TnpB family protein, partial [Methanosarcinales archaeon]